MKLNYILFLFSCICCKTCSSLDRIFSPELCSAACLAHVRNGTDGHTQDLINTINNSGLTLQNIRNPPAPFTFVTTRNAINNNGETVYLPLIVKATVSGAHVPRVPRQPSDIPRAARTNVNKMYSGVTNDIDVGHIVAYQNGGTTDLFNFVGQKLALNRGPYKVVENYINDWIKFGGTVDFTVAIVYSGTIPQEFAIKMKFFNQDGSLHSDVLDIIMDNTV